MKTLKFKHDFVKEILAGRKNTTWRLFDDKDLQINDELDLIDSENGNGFGKAKITNVIERTIKNLTDEELKNHQYINKEAMLESHKKYYGDKVNLDTAVKIITFELL
ncbi:MAG: ASCH domain-containing protein [Candidatus Yanofskybacteria bacterium]|nr:ASCH domain-containing protein [Candidatus Yanofskybacteria bacterium]